MPVHVVRQGQTLKTICRERKLDRTALLEAPENAELWERRPNPELLCPGDELHVPESNVVQAVVGQLTVLRVASHRAAIELVMKDAEGRPLAEVPYRLEIGADVREGVTTAEGGIRELVPADGEDLLLSCGGRSYTLKPGHLGPLSPDVPVEHRIHGVKARLRNLGYPIDALDSRLDAGAKSALQEFQRANGLDPTGEADAATCERLVTQHGC